MTTISNEADTSISLITLGQPKNDDTWLISDWNAGQSSIMRWTTDNVRATADGGVQLTLDAAPAGAARPYEGGEIQSSASSSTGTWSWLVEAPDMVDGAVFGMFLYKADWQNDPWLEFDFEFVGSDTTQVEINIHMEDAAGRHITLEGGPLIIDLGFDAAEGQHLYEIALDGVSATFKIDGAVVAVLDADDMPGDVWYTGELKSFVDLWAAPPSLESWTGKWSYDGTPLVATIDQLALPGDAPIVFSPDVPAELVAPAPEDATDAEDPLSQAQPESDDPVIELAPEPEPLTATAPELLPEPEPLPESDSVSTKGGSGKGNGKPTKAPVVATYDDEGANAVNIVTGGKGRDQLDGTLETDVMTGGGNKDAFVFASAAHIGTGATADRITDFTSGVDVIDLRQIQGLSLSDAETFSGTPGAMVFDAADSRLRGDIDGDGMADFELILDGVGMLGTNDLLY